MDSRWSNSCESLWYQELTKGTFVINVADCMARWTNDIFQSTIHRAINRSGVERYSVPMFFGVDYECIIDVLHFCNLSLTVRPYPAALVKIAQRNTSRWWLENGSGHVLKGDTTLRKVFPRAKSRLIVSIDLCNIIMFKVVKRKVRWDWMISIQTVFTPWSMEESWASRAVILCYGHSVPKARENRSRLLLDGL